MTARRDAPEGGAPPPPETHSLLRTMRTVAWSFLGIRPSASHQQDLQKLKPHQVVIAGLIGTALFVGVLVIAVRWVVGSAGA